MYLEVVRVQGSRCRVKHSFRIRYISIGLFFVFFFSFRLDNQTRLYFYFELFIVCMLMCFCEFIPL